MDSEWEGLHCTCGNRIAEHTRGCSVSIIYRLVDALCEVRDWNNADLRGIDDITPDAQMLHNRRKVINKALTGLGKAQP